VKILHIITSLKIGGAESALCNLLEKFKEKKGDEHFVAYFHYGPNVLKIKKLGFKIFQIKGLFCLYDPVFYFRLKKLAKTIQPDVIHSALWSANFFSRLIAKRLKIPIICDLHSNFSFDGNLRAWLEKFTVSWADKYVAVSTLAKNGFKRAVIEKVGYAQKQKEIESKTLLIQNGIDVERVRNNALSKKLERKEFGIGGGDFVIGAVGRLDLIKSYDVLIRSFYVFINKIQSEKSKLNRDVKLCIVGDGSQREELKILVQRLGILNRVIFVGQRVDAHRFYPLFDCFVLSSESEGLSIALLEALCFGLPIITTNRGLRHDVIVDRQNGFLVSVKDEEALTRAMLGLYSNPALVSNMSKANLKLVKEKFDIDRVKDAYESLYLEVVTDK